MATKKAARKVLLIGWDAADWNIINPLMDQGLMPALGHMVNNGCMGNLSTLEPPLSPIIWTSIATGKHADKHGILGFTEVADNERGVRPVMSSSRKVKTLWNILSENKLNTHVVGWWPSHPAEKIRGVMISNLFKEKGKKGMLTDSVFPPELAPLFAHLRLNIKEIESEHLLPFVPLAAQIDQEKDHKLQSIAKIISDASSIHSAITWILENREWDFAAVYYDSIDHFCHGFMKYHPPRLPWIEQSDFNLYNNVITAAYRFHDMMLQRLLELAGKDTLVVLISDHGYHSGTKRLPFIPGEAAGPAYEHRDFGIFCACGPGIRKDERIYGASVLDITPSILHTFGIPKGKDMDGKVLTQIFENEQKTSFIDTWENTGSETNSNDKELLHDPLAETTALKQLADMGYIDELPESKEKAMKKTAGEWQFNLARVYIGKGQYEKAIEVLEKLRMHENPEPRIILRLISCYNTIGSYQKSISLFDEAENALNHILNLDTKVKPESEKAQARLINKVNQARFDKLYLELLKGKTFQLSGKLEEAKNIFNKILKLNGINSNILLQIAHSYLNMNMHDEAAQHYHKVLSLDPDNAQAHYGLAVYHFRKHRYDTAADYALNSIGLMYYQPMAHFYLGEALFKMQEYKHARNAYKVALKIQPDMGAAQLRLEEILRICPDLSTVNTEKVKVATPDPVQNEIFEINAKIQSPLKRKTFKHDEIIVVSGLPRSGTSLMMQMLHAGGIDIFTDNIRKPDESNPKGYFEHEAVKSLRSNKKWMKNSCGKAIKIIAQLLPYAPMKYHYKVIFMEREIHEVINSQLKMTKKTSRQDNLFRSDLLISYNNHLAFIRKWLDGKSNIEHIIINFKDAIDNPEKTAEAISRFTGRKMDIKKMAAVVDKNLYRSNK